MLNDNFRKIGSNVKAMNKKGEGIFGLLIAFSIPLAGQGHESLGKSVKEQEKFVEAELKVKLSDNSTFKAAKSIIVRCVEHGISLVDSEGKARGKTDLERELEAFKTEKTPLEKFKATISTADKIADTLSDAEVITAAALVDSLLKSILPRIKAAA